MLSGFGVESKGGAAALTFVPVVVAGAGAGLLFKGAPTAISQRWFGSPCGGFMPGAVLVGVGTCVVVTNGCAFTVAPVVVGAGAGLLFNGAPTDISQR